MPPTFDPLLQPIIIPNKNKHLTKIYEKSSIIESNKRFRDPNHGTNYLIIYDQRDNRLAALFLLGSMHQQKDNSRSNPAVILYDIIKYLDGLEIWISFLR